MGQSLTQPPDIPQADTAALLADALARIGRLEAKLEQYYRRACLMRRHQEIFAETLPGYLAPARAQLTLVRDESCRAILEAARR